MSSTLVCLSDQSHRKSTPVKEAIHVIASTGCNAHSGSTAVRVLPFTQLCVVQVQRLLELQSYLNGGVSDWPASVQTPAVKQEIHVPEPTGHNRPVLNPSPDADQLLQSVKLEAPHAVARPATAAPVSKWTLAEDSEADQPAIPVSKWVAQEVRNC
jgi:hypothetical protein